MANLPLPHPLLPKLNAIELVLIYTPTWDLHSGYTIDVNRVERTCGFTMHGLRAGCMYPVPGDMLHVDNIHSTPFYDDTSLPVYRAPAELSNEMSAFWCSLSGRPAKGFEEYCCYKHLKYFHSNHRFVNENMFKVGMELGKELLASYGERSLMETILRKYRFGERINCFDFMNYLEAEYGYNFKILYYRVRNVNYLKEIICLYNLDKEMIDYKSDDLRFNYTDTFILTGDLEEFEQQRYWEYQRRQQLGLPWMEEAQQGQNVEEEHVQQVEEEQVQQVEDEGEEVCRLEADVGEEVCRLEVDVRSWVRSESERIRLARKKRSNRFVKAFSFFGRCLCSKR